MNSEEKKIIERELADWIDGDTEARERFAGTHAEEEWARDAAHDASEIADVLREVGGDYEHPSDFTVRVLANADSAPTEPSSATGAARKATPRAARKPGSARAVFSWAAAAAMLAAIGVGASLLGERGSEDQKSGATAAAGEATLVKSSRSGGGSGGVTAELPGAEVRPIAAGEVIPAGATLRLDERTRATVELADGTTLALDQGTEFEIADDAPRTQRLLSGRLVATVPRVEGAPAATYLVPGGRVEVLGTRFSLTTNEAGSSVVVTRGRVRVTGDDGSHHEVGPGEEGRLRAEGETTLAPAGDLEREISWSETLIDPSLADATPGLGSLRAYKPGEKRDRDWPLALASHRVSVRIVGDIARTEIEETFASDSSEVLEGVFTFPLPPDARIERLALDVDGKFEEGAFVAKDRAAKIWRGVIANAAPRKQRPKEDIIWVPGPWRDPALLEWQQGGRVELRIFPIPARGARTVKLVYTQSLEPRGDRRNYVYPLPHAADGSASAKRFDMDVAVRGAASDAPIVVRGADLKMTDDGDRKVMAFGADDFIPRGAITVDYAPSGADSELRAWTFEGNAAAAPSISGSGAKGETDPDVVLYQRSIAEDDRAYALLSLRPSLPGWRSERPRAVAIVVDTSQSMVGERHKRATRVAAELIAEMDEGDRVQVLACDLDCAEYSGGLAVPNAEHAESVRKWLESREPAGATYIERSLATAASSLASAGDRDKVVIYLGDGVSAAGHRGSKAARGYARELRARDGVVVHTLGIGADADERTLAALSHGGGGHHLSYRPGQSVSGVALAALTALYGVSLENARVMLPKGAELASSAELPNLLAGGEYRLAVRFRGEVAGEVLLTGTVGGEQFENRYPLRLEPTRHSGNAFVPRAWAQARIESLQAGGRAEDEATIVALSKAYSVMSQHTSLLVLESQAMFDAFGIDRARASVEWTGDESEAVLSSSADGLFATDKADDKSSTRSRKRKPRRAAATKSPRPMRLGGGGGGVSDPFSGPFGGGGGGTGSIGGIVGPSSEPRARGGRYMRRVWFRVPSLSSFDAVHPNIVQAIDDAEEALKEKPDSRERHRALLQALAYGGELERAYDIALRWHQRDPLDPAALIYMADTLGRLGRRADAVRYLSGIVDLQPDSAELHQRLARAFARGGRKELSCAHRVTVAELEDESSERIAAAIRCERAAGRERAAERVLAAADTELRAKAAAGAALPDSAERAAGDLVIDANWDAPIDLDLSVITPRGERLSWLGGHDGVAVEDAAARGRERMSLRRIRKGNYLIEISRADGSAPTPVRGTIETVLMGKRQRFEFDLSGRPSATVGRAQIRMDSRLENL